MEEDAPGANVGHGQARERLLEAAAKLFSAKSYEDVSIRDIAGAAGVRHGGVNYHFRGKSELYLEVVQRFGLCNNHTESGGAPPWETVLEITDREQAQGLLHQILFHTLAKMVLPQDAIASGLLNQEMSRKDGPSDEIFEAIIIPKHKALGHLISVLAPHITDPSELRLISIGMTSQCIAFRHARPVMYRLLGMDASEEMTPEMVGRIVDRIVRTTLHGLLGEQDS